jgi:hypothetical protein
MNTTNLWTTTTGMTNDLWPWRFVQDDSQVDREEPMKEEEQDRVEFLESEVTRLRRERDEARFVARFVARAAGLDEKKVRWRDL